MGRFVKGDVVVVPFPYTNLRGEKRRPALVIASAGDNDLLLAQISSRTLHDPFAIEILPDDFHSGGLRVVSNIRPNKLFTAEEDLIIYKAGILHYEKMQDVVNTIVELISR